MISTERPASQAVKVVTGLTTPKGSSISPSGIMISGPPKPTVDWTNTPKVITRRNSSSLVMETPFRGQVSNWFLMHRLYGKTDRL